MSGQLEVGVVVRRVFAIYVEQASILFPAAAVVFAIGGIAATVIADSGLWLLALGLQLVTSSIYTGMIVELVADLRSGNRDATAGQLLRAVRPVLGELIAVSVVTGACEFVGLFLLVPGLILLTVWAVVAPVVVVEHPGGLRALGRSRALVRGNGWPVFGVIIAFGLIALSGLAIALLASAAGTAASLVAQVVIGVLVLPLISLASAVLYFELRGLQTQPPSSA